MTNSQLQVLHTTRRRLEAIQPTVFDRAWYDLVLLNLGRVRPDADGKISSKGLAPAGFERVMAFLEEQLDDLGQKPGTKWRDIERRRGHYLTTRQEWQITASFAELQKAGSEYTLSGLVKRITAGRAEQVHDLNPTEAHKMIEMLKSIVERATSPCLHPQPTEATGESK